MHRRDNEIELREATIRQIEGAVRLDIAFDAREQPDAGAFRVDRADPRRVIGGVPLVEAIRHGQRLTVIGDREILEPGRARRFGHRSDIVPAVGLARVAVQIAAEVGTLDQPRQRVRFGRLDLAA